MSNDLETQIRAVADAAFDQTAPVNVDRYVANSASAQQSTRGRWLLVAASTALLVALVGAIAWISDSDDPGLTPVDPPIPAIAPLDFSTGFSARGMLTEIPAPPERDPLEPLRIVGADLALIADLGGVERTGGDDLSAPPSDWFEVLFVDETFAVPYSRLLSTTLSVPEAQEELGYSFLDVDRFVGVEAFGFSVGSDTYFREFDAVVLRSNISDLAASAGTDSVIDLGSGADDQTAVRDRTPLRPIGRPLRIGVDEQRSMVAVTGRLEAVTSWLDPASPTLADGGDFAVAAAVLDLDDDLYAAELTATLRNANDENSIWFRGDRPESGYPITEEFTTMAMGWSGVGDTTRVSIVYVFADEAAASSSVGPITGLYEGDSDIGNSEQGAILSDVLSVDSVEAVGRTVVVTGRPTSSGPGAVSALLSDPTRSGHR